MPNYCVNKNANQGGEHEVHDTNCGYAPQYQNQVQLGLHADCQSALKAAKQHYTNVDGCFYCSPACHTR